MITSASFRARISLLRSKRMASLLRIAALGLLVVFAGYELFQNLFAVHAQYPPVQSTIFLDTTRPTFPLTTSQPDGTVTYNLTSLSGTTITRGQIAATGSQTILTLPRLPDDYYLLQVTDQTGSIPTSLTLPFVVLA